jgi:hypothetical protein
MTLQSFQIDGFLSPDVLKWSDTAHADNAKYFELAEDLNRRVTAMLLQNPPPMNKMKQLVSSLLLARTLTSYCAAVLLARRGMIADARAIVRSCTESAIALGAMATVDDFFDQMAEAHDSHRRKIAQMFLETPPTQQELTDEQVSALKEMVEGIETKYGRKPNSIVWASVAENAGMRDLYNLVYRDMSGDGAHATIESLNHHINADADSVIKSLSYMPRAEGVADILSAASRAVMLAAEAFAKVFEIEHGLSEHLASWKAVMDKA